MPDRGRARIHCAPLGTVGIGHRLRACVVQNRHKASLYQYIAAPLRGLALPITTLVPDPANARSVVQVIIE
jgi:hypothetical protein